MYKRHRFPPDIISYAIRLLSVQDYSAFTIII
jgi:hypothetical protein